jgi:hypothetical protein
MGLLAGSGSWLRPSSLLIPSELHPPLAMPLQPPNGVCRLTQPTAPRGLTRDASERPSLACLITSGGEWVERKRWTPLSLC